MPVQGRSYGTGFPDSTFEEMPARAVVNETFVRQQFGGRDPVEKTITLGPLGGPLDPVLHRTVTIVGVAADVRNQGLRQPVEPQVYVPWSSASRGFPSLLVRTASDAAASINMIRREVALIDKQVAVVQPRTLAEALDRSFYAEPRFSLIVLGIFAVTGTVLVSVGVFSVMAYTVSRQKKDIAVRIALGASRRQVFTRVVRFGAQLLTVGGMIGVAASFATGRLLSSQLWNVSPHDPLTMVAALTVISVVALAACYLPARRAMRVDPMGR